MNYSTQSRRPAAKAIILVIEDNADQWFIIRWALEQRFPEVEAIWFKNSAQALMYLDSCQLNEQAFPRLILLDLYIPNRESGWRFLETIKLHHLYREIPTVMLSWSADREDIRESYMLRSNSYLVKPDSYEKWLECFTVFRDYWWDAVTLPLPA
ncbi:response regulator [Spirosoma sp. KUDC1026]|uniref:response regulator n=1 Tax=Spirosoma sp. KUDC1026 TaxID=2745947 RepID=UPI00159BA0A0|nr:response regulator [Spirosoma sp. KUDC1026]QKZ11791.1 response regulator [Spirosoma sp. KUDC1026]